jgi:hypothetical protein
MMRFFTNGTWRPSTPEIEEVPTPIGEHCLACGTAIRDGDCGVSMVHMDVSGATYRPWHLACFRRSLGIEGAQA